MVVGRFPWHVLALLSASTFAASADFGVGSAHGLAGVPGICDVAGCTLRGDGLVLLQRVLRPSSSKPSPKVVTMSRLWVFDLLQRALLPIWNKLPPSLVQVSRSFAKETFAAHEELIRWGFTVGVVHFAVAVMASFMVKCAVAQIVRRTLTIKSRKRLPLGCRIAFSKCHVSVVNGAIEIDDFVVGPPRTFPAEYLLYSGRVRAALATSIFGLVKACILGGELKLAAIAVSNCKVAVAFEDNFGRTNVSEALQQIRRLRHKANTAIHDGNVESSSLAAISVEQLIADQVGLHIARHPDAPPFPTGPFERNHVDSKGSSMPISALVPEVLQCLLAHCEEYIGSLAWGSHVQKYYEPEQTSKSAVVNSKSKICSCMQQ